MGRALTLGQQYWEALQLSRPPSLFSLIECLLRGMKRAFTLKPSSSNLVHASLTTRAPGKDITHPACLWFVSILSALLLLLIFGNQLPLGLACITVMANYQSQLLKLETWLIGYNMWGWIKKVMSGNWELSENNDSRVWKVDVIREFAVLEKRDRSIPLSWAHQLPVLWRVWTYPIHTHGTLTLFFKGTPTLGNFLRKIISSQGCTFCLHILIHTSKLVLRYRMERRVV